jgi:hypothetical protein
LGQRFDAKKMSVCETHKDDPTLFQAL